LADESSDRDTLNVPPTKISYVSGRPATLHLRKCKLLIDKPDGTTSEYIFDQQEIDIGGMDDNDLIVDDDTVSRYHCRIFQEDDAYILKDKGSTNGTFINRVRIREAYLKPGCTITLGKSDVRFQNLDERVQIHARDLHDPGEDRPGRRDGGDRG
jgi:hypothetical protein